MEEHVNTVARRNKAAQTRLSLDAQLREKNEKRFQESEEKKTVLRTSFGPEDPSPLLYKEKHRKSKKEIRTRLEE